MILMPRGGGDGGTAEATPSELQRAGQGFMALSNACGGMAQTGDLQSGGQFELGSVQFVGGGAGLSLPTGFTQDVEAVTQGFLGVLVSAQQQFADAAMDLFQVAGDFQTADSEIPSDVHRIPTPLGMPKGITAYQTPAGGVYYQDHDGTVVSDTDADGSPVRDANPEIDTNNPYERVVGQTDTPPGG